MLFVVQLVADCLLFLETFVFNRDYVLKLISASILISCLLVNAVEEATEFCP